MTPALRTSTVAHVAPLAVFLGFIALVSLLRVENPMLPWWRHAPEQWVYPLQTLTVGALLWCYRRYYTFAPIRGYAMAAGFALIGIVWWCVPALIWQKINASGGTAPEWASWFGVAERAKGFDPTMFRDHPYWQGAALVMRLARLVLLVPFVEEIFWRGFLMRYVQADDGDFQRIPFGRHSWPAFATTTLGFMLVHDPTDWLGALGFGSLAYLLAVRTKSLGACVFMHAVANLLLGAYVLATRQWGFW